MARIKTFFLSSILAATILFSGASLASAQAASESPTKVDGIQNWAHVTDTLYRGAQPSSAGFKTLQQMGVGIVVDFRDERGEIASESKAVQTLGMKYVSIPWSGSAKPSTIQVVQFLDLVRENPQAKIFVHCKRGADRTGVMVAAYRIVVEHKDVSDAVAEMHQFHYDHFWLPQLERYVESLPQLLSADPLFAAYATTPTTKSSAKPSAPAPATAALRTAPAETPASAQ
jgi:protein tyrosine/serine phosphatase